MRILFALLMCAAPLGAQQPPSLQVPETSRERKVWLEEWLAFVRPTEEELSFEQVGWRNALWPAVEEARRLGRPLLLWTMNGHPLGCT